MNQYLTLMGIVSKNHQYQTKVITFCVNHTDQGDFFFTRSDTGKVHSYASQAELDYKARFLIDLGYTECPSVLAYPLV